MASSFSEQTLVAIEEVATEMAAKQGIDPETAALDALTAVAFLRERERGGERVEIHLITSDGQTSVLPHIPRLGRLAL